MSAQPLFGLGAAICICVAVMPAGLAQDNVFDGNGSPDSALGTRPAIEIWYGNRQRFGHLGGHPQRWINVLGNVSPAETIVSVDFSLNGSTLRQLCFQEDKKRLARPGDFNIEIARSELRVGENIVVIAATDKRGNRTKNTVRVEFVTPEGNWPLPHEIDWSKARSIAEGAQVVDGKWELTPSGVRSVERYYDRVIAFGDASWRDYEVATTVTVHALTPPRQDPNLTGVTHAAIALRWPGHDADGRQPSVKWFPLGATAEFRLGKDLQQCRWRIFDGKKEFHVESTRRRAIEFGKPYHMKHRVETLEDGRSRYRVRLWAVGEPEPIMWDFERLEPGDLASGSALLIAHHSDVTFGNVFVVPVAPSRR